MISQKNEWFVHPSLFLSQEVSQVGCAKSNASGGAGAISGQASRPVESLTCCGTEIPFSPTLPPTNLTGTCALNRFALQGEFFKTLTWTLSESVGVMAQKIYRDEVLIATLSPVQTSYQDHTRPQGAERYQVTAVSDAGESTGTTELISCQ